MVSNCPFCHNFESGVLVFSDAHVQAVVSRAPINAYHVLIVPREHVERLPELSDEVAVAVMSAARRLGRAVAEAGSADGVVYITEDDLTGQGYNRVAHWKLHVIARYRDDAVRLDWHREPDPGIERRSAIAEAVRACLPP
jgi:histidine triad (HIT) family protein